MTMRTPDVVSDESPVGAGGSARRPTLDHVPGLDGLRGVAVAAVVAYHLGLLSGGFLGVDVFFVLSGFLITSLLVGEVQGTGRVDARRFWGRRVRRLVPAVLVMVPTVIALAWAVRWPRTRLESLAVDAFATLTWWANWRQASGTSYWNADTPSLFRHAWSLSIEEQFYLVWPVVLIGVAVLARRFGRSVPACVGAVAALGFLTSSAWLTVLSNRLDPSELSRAYVGTDTRVLAPLAGCALACLLVHLRSRGVHPTPTVAWDLGVVVALLVLAALVVTVHVSSPALYRNGGFVVVALASAVLVAATASRASRAMGWAHLAPVRWLGLRSYGIYLWSWPLQVIAEHRFPEAPRPLLVVGVVVTSLAVAELSFRVVEDPIRRGTWWASRPILRRPAWGLGVAVAASAVIVAGSLAVDPPAHEQIDTRESAAMVTHLPPPPVGSTDPSDEAGLRVMLTGDSVMWTTGYYLPEDRLPDGIATIDGRAVIGCGLLAADGWLYRSTDPNAPSFVEPAGGACAAQNEAERIGLTGSPDVVLAWPGAWEYQDVKSPEGEVVLADEPAFRELVVDELVSRARAAHEVGAGFAMISWACPGPDASPARRDPDYLRRINEMIVEAAERARVEHGANTFVIEPTEAVCVDADPLGAATSEKNRAMNDEVHVKSREGAIWVWETWLGPALRDHLLDPG